MRRDSKKNREGFAAVVLISATTVIALIALLSSAATPARSANTWQAYAAYPNFYPSTLQVFVGDTITWHNNDSFTHTVKSDSAAWTEINLPAGADRSLQLNSAGIYGYFCSLHPIMTGTIIVNDTQVPEFPSMTLMMMGMVILILGMIAALRRR